MRLPTEYKGSVELEETKDMDFPVITLEGVSVHYRFVTDRPTSIKEFAIRLIKKDIERHTVNALEDVSIVIRKGEVFGIVGRNGAGKTTLLKIIARIIRPTKGRVCVWGRVTSLLGVGAGFSHELTGRENIFLYSALLGRSQERTLELIDEIIEFAELREFIDAPMRTYSTGMVGRLGFAVAMAETPDILLVDEVLAVGDVAFQEKCQERFHEIQMDGTTIIIVSHSMTAIKELCDRVLYLAEGKVVCVDTASRVVESYHSSNVAQYI